MLEFESPYLLWLLVLLVPLAWRALRGLDRRSASLQYSSLNLFASFSVGGSLRWRKALPLLRLAALALLLIALARPRFGTVQRDVSQEGVDLFYCLDISGSMRAEDFKPNRLEKALELTREFSEKRETDRQGVVLFCGEAFVLCPLTFDSGTVQKFLENVTFDEIGVRGTAIGTGLARALKKMVKSTAKSRVVILMTDGENNAGEITPQQAIAAAKAMDVRVYTIGIGSDGSAWATVTDQYGRKRKQRVPTSIDEELLQRIADDTGGLYRRATSASELEAILDEIDSLEKTEIEMKEFRSYDERMALFCWPALAFILLELLLANTWFLKIP